MFAPLIGVDSFLFLAGFVIIPIANWGIKLHPEILTDTSLGELVV